MARPLVNRVTYGDAILARFINIEVPKSLKIDLLAFKGQHAVFLKATAAVQKAEIAYDAAVTRAAKLDSSRDKTILALANKLPAEGLGARANPFVRFTAHSPSRLVGLPYAAETTEVRTLLAGILVEKPSKEITALCAELEKQNEAVSDALDELSAPLAALVEARSRRDATIPDWEKHFRRLKDAAKVAYRDAAGRSAALFAEPTAVLTHTRPKHRKVKSGAATPAVGDAVSATAAKKPAKRRKRRG